MAPARVFRIHAGAFCAGVATLAGANWLGAGSRWLFWLLAAWSVVFGVHFLVHKARTVNERWARQRAADLRSKSYDASHIDSIAERYEAKRPQDKD